MAGTTTRFGFPYQEAADPPDGASLGQDLAEAVETSLGAEADWVNGRIDDLPKGVIAQYARTSAITGVTTTETGYVRIDNIPIRAGYRYAVLVPVCNITADATDRIGRARLRASTSGNATTASTVIGQTRNSQPTDVSQTNITPLHGTYDATTTGTLSVLWSVVRAGAVGSVGLYGAPTEPADIYVSEIGLTPAASGTDI